MLNFVFVFGLIVMGLVAKRSLADTVPTVKSCENLKVEIGTTLIRTNYNGYRTSVTSPCLLVKDGLGDELGIQLGMTYGLINIPYLGVDRWEGVLGHEVLFSFQVRHDLFSNQKYAAGLKTQVGFGNLRVESQKYKNIEFDKEKINSIWQSDLALGWYATYQIWETTLGLISRNFDYGEAYKVKDMLMPQSDFGYQVSVSYLIK